MTYQGRTLSEWLSLGFRNGTITQPQTAVCAYCMQTPKALAWVAAIVKGDIAEPSALEAVGFAVMQDTAALVDSDACHTVLI